MYKFLRPLLFLIDPETIHNLVFVFLQFKGKVPGFNSLLRILFDKKDKRLERKFMDLTFRNPVGLAAGFDKSGTAVDDMARFGFGFVEIGTVTPRPQSGNPKPRLFRLSKDKALINRMGFNNAGAVEVARALKRRSSDIIVGGNIGKNKSTPNAEALNDYVFCFEQLHPFVDYFVVNVSSPNTPGLRELQEKVPLGQLLGKLKQLSLTKTPARPVLLKIAPDLTDSQLDDIIDVLQETKADGVIATNTTVERQGLKTRAKAVEGIGHGGLSGKPLAARALATLKYLRRKLGNGFLIIGCGGIMTSDDALERLEAGADLVQVYTGFIYQGPSFAKKINKRILSEHQGV